MFAILIILVLLGCIISSPNEESCTSCEGEGTIIHPNGLSTEMCKKCDGTGTIIRND